MEMLNEEEKVFWRGAVYLNTTNHSSRLGSVFECTANRSSPPRAVYLRYNQLAAFRLGDSVLKYNQYRLGSILKYNQIPGLRLGSVFEYITNHSSRYRAVYLNTNLQSPRLGSVFKYNQSQLSARQYS